MEKQLILLQEILDDFAALHRVAVVMTDALGNFLTRPSGEGEQFKPIIDEEHKILLSRLDTAGIESSVEMRGINLEPMRKAAVLPIVTHNRVEHLLWMVYSNDNAAESKLQLWKKLQTTAKIMANLIVLEDEKESIRQQLAAVRELSQRVDQRPTSENLSEMLQLIYKSSKEMQFLGYAIKEDGMTFRVAEFFCEKETSMLNTQFSLGEGFLGQVATTRQTASWNQISVDPRIDFFKQHNVYPKALLCFPIIQANALIGLLFGGSEVETDRMEEWLPWGHLVVSLLSVHQTFQLLRNDRNTYYMRMSMLMEMCKSLSVVKETKRVLFILVDLSLNLIQGTFSCVILKPSAEKMNIVSRGMSRSQAEKYMKDVAERYPVGAMQLTDFSTDNAGLHSFEGTQVGSPGTELEFAL